MPTSGDLYGAGGKHDLGGSLVFGGSDELKHELGHIYDFGEDPRRQLVAPRSSSLPSKHTPLRCFVQTKIRVFQAIKLTSVKTVVPYEYYALPFCRPVGELHYKSENLGEVMRGDRIVNTPYEVSIYSKDAN